MENAHLPLEKAHEPNEAAHQPNNKNTQDTKNGVQPTKIRFAEGTLSSEISKSQKSCSTYNDSLSQPVPGISHRKRMMWLQSRRTTGLWVNCDDCGNWRYLPHILDSHELPQKWYCRMNPDSTAADCSIPEAPLCIRDEEDLIHSQYSAGSLVWARMPGWPWWPAMVDDCPDVEQFYWLDGFSDIPTHYNVVFFDASDVTRAWVAPELLKTYTSKDNHKIDKKYHKRLSIAIKHANNAEIMSLHDRLAKYSFISRYLGNVNTPRKINKNELEKFKNKLKRKYNIEFSDASTSESDDETSVVDPACLPVRKTNKAKTVKKTKPKNVNKPKLTLDDLKDTNTDTLEIEISKSHQVINNTDANTTLENDKLKTVQKRKLKEVKPKITPDNVKVTNTDTVEIEISQCQEVIPDTNANTTVENETECALLDLNPNSKETNSMVVHNNIGSTVLSVPVEQSFDNDTSTTYVPGSENESEVPTSVQDIIDTIGRSASPNSDDFEF